MRKINWKVRLKNKTFWLFAVPTILLIISKSLAIFGIEFDTTTLIGQLKEIIELIFGLLGALGIVVDFTTKGFGDSQQALTYEEPKADLINEINKEEQNND